WASRCEKDELLGGLLFLSGIVSGGGPMVVSRATHPSVEQIERSSSKARFETKQLPLPGAHGLVTLDYFAFDRSTGRLWVPAGNTGRVEVIDGVSDEIAEVGPFPTAEFELKGKPYMLGASSISIGDGVIYVGNRADSSICMIDATTLKRGDCFRVASPSNGLAASPDGLAYVAKHTTGAPPIGVPASEPSITILDASTPRRLKLRAKLPPRRIG